MHGHAQLPTWIVIQTPVLLFNAANALTHWTISPDSPSHHSNLGLMNPLIPVLFF